MFSINEIVFHFLTTGLVPHGVEITSAAKTALKDNRCFQYSFDGETHRYTDVLMSEKGDVKCTFLDFVPGTPSSAGRWIVR